MSLVTSLHTDAVAYAELYARETFERWAGRVKVPYARRLAAAAARRIGRGMQRRFDQHIRASDFVLASGDQLHRLGGVRAAHEIGTLRRGLDAEVFSANPARPDEREDLRRELGIADDAFVLSFSGRLSSGKQVLRVARVTRTLAREGYDVHAVFAGQGPQAVAIDSILGARAHRMGQISQTRLAALLRASDVFVFPSQVEIWANAVAEARACGTPVVVDAAGGGQLVRSPGEDGLIAADDDAAWVTAVRQLLDDPDRHAAMRAAALRSHASMVPTWHDVLNHDLWTVWQRVAVGADSMAAIRARS